MRTLVWDSSSQIRQSVPQTFVFGTPQDDACADLEFDHKRRLRQLMVDTELAPYPLVLAVSLSSVLSHKPRRNGTLMQYLENHGSGAFRSPCQRADTVVYALAPIAMSPKGNCGLCSSHHVIRFKNASTTTSSCLIRPFFVPSSSKFLRGIQESHLRAACDDKDETTIMVITSEACGKINLPGGVPPACGANVVYTYPFNDNRLGMLPFCSTFDHWDMLRSRFAVRH